MIKVLRTLLGRRGDRKSGGSLWPAKTLRNVVFEFDATVKTPRAMLDVMRPAGVDLDQLAEALEKARKAGATLVTVGTMIRGGKLVPRSWWAESRHRGVGNRAGVVEAIDALTTLLIARGAGKPRPEDNPGNQRIQANRQLAQTAITNAQSAVHAGDREHAIRILDYALSEIDDSYAKGPVLNARAAVAAGRRKITR